MANEIFKVDICGYNAELPVLPLPSGIKIAFFNLHGNQELTEHCGKELAKRLGDCDVLVTAESKGLQLTHVVARELGMSDIQFGIMMIANLCIGLCTPPVGSCLFLGCGIGRTSIANVTKPMIPFFLAMIAAVLLITLIPALSEWLPDAAGLLK